MVTEETRQMSFEDIKSSKEKRYKQILEVLEGKQMTAKEIAVKLYEKGLIPTSERNFTAPRLTELCDKGKVKSLEKKKRCKWTGKMVAVYEIVKDGQNGRSFL